MKWVAKTTYFIRHNDVFESNELVTDSEGNGKMKVHSKGWQGDFGNEEFSA
jgi:hypothetical protein